MKQRSQATQQTVHAKVVGVVLLLLLLASFLMLQLGSKQGTTLTTVEADGSVQWVEAQPAQVSVNWNSNATPTPTPTANSNYARASSLTGTESYLVLVTPEPDKP